MFPQSVTHSPSTQEDDSKFTLAEFGRTMTSFFGAGFEFYNMLENFAAKVCHVNNITYS